MFFAGSTHRLTYAHKGGKNVADDPLAAGLPSYVMQEEFDRYQGYWWQPYSNGTDQTDSSIYYSIKKMIRYFKLKLKIYILYFRYCVSNFVRRNRRK